jgi:hypothetical protein
LKSIVVVIIFIALTLIWWTFSRNAFDQQQAKFVTRAYSFVVYRNAVNNFQLVNKTEGEVPLLSLTLPVGFAAPNDWHNTTVVEAGEMHCYVWGEANPDEFDAVFELLHKSRAIGWAENGNLVRPGAGWPLPAFIPNGSVVSVISIH